MDNVKKKNYLFLKYIVPIKHQITNFSHHHHPFSQKKKSIKQKAMSHAGLMDKSARAQRGFLHLELLFSNVFHLKFNHMDFVLLADV